MSEETAFNIVASFSGLAVLWRIVIYQGNEITRMSKRLDRLYKQCFGENVDTDNKKD